MRTLQRFGAFVAIWGLALATTAAMPGLADAASGDDIVFLDRFNESSFAGSDGNGDWTGPWNELGETDGPKKGIVRVKPSSLCDSHCLVIGGRDVGISGKGVVRSVDLSGAEEARLRFDVDIEVEHEDETFGSVTVAVAAEGGNWTPLAVFAINEETHGTSGTEHFDITEYVSPDTRLAFFALGWVNAHILFDNVKIEAMIESPPTTTTTTTLPPTTTSTTTTTLPPTTTSTTTTTTTVPPTTTSTTTTRPPRTTTTTTTSTTTTTTTVPPTTSTTTTTTGPGGGTSDPPADPPSDGGETTQLVDEDVLSDPRFFSKETLAARQIDSPANGADRMRASVENRSPADIMLSTAEIARVAVETHALEAFLLGVLVAWLSLRGLGARDELDFDAGNNGKTG